MLSRALCSIKSSLIELVFRVLYKLYRYEVKSDAEIIISFYFVVAVLDRSYRLFNHLFIHYHPHPSTMLKISLLVRNRYGEFYEIKESDVVKQKGQKIFTMVIESPQRIQSEYTTKEHVKSCITTTSSSLLDFYVKVSCTSVQY